MGLPATIEEATLGKLILWLSGLLLAILTMNITVYLALTGVYLVGRAVGGFSKARKALRAGEGDPRA